MIATVYIDLRPVAGGVGSTPEETWDAAMAGLRASGYANFADRLDEDRGFACWGGDYGTLLLGRTVEYRLEGAETAE
jgi:hypothetical protein